MFRRIKAIIPHVIPSTTAGVVHTLGSSIYGANFDITIQCTTGVVYINPLVAATTANGIRMEEGDELDLKVASALSVIGDSTTAAYQGIIWE